MASSIRGGGRQHVDAAEFADLLNQVGDYDKELQKKLLRNIREAAKPITAEMRKRVTSEHGASRIRVAKKIRGGGTTQVTTHTSALVAKGISFRMNKGKGGASAVFTASSRALPENRKVMAKALNKRSFRHPVIGTTTIRKGRLTVHLPKSKWRWAEQAGRPYFQSAIYDEQGRIYGAINDALDEAAKALGKSRSS